ncbi:Membrane protein involved in the export of O-antigen and teichoic acid [Bizionia echini]|uniref:Membrane protein involved in the export of O-antigen and teichoic acid n=1 Tax=Bizionia echini TaxID=649333 RepID=A0A1I4Z7A5_9FLAO|nr:oligosaccharide flippase family protein [Bizionia echini]SFN46164.1 Membrane protein involved in the export of O-antigen and teichoic acid [Bizionia echini]
MGTIKTFFKDTIIYGLATVLPRLMNLILVRLQTDKLETSSYSDNTTFYVYAAFFNVLLTYGMETAFFRFFTKHEEKDKVFSTTLISLTVSTILFLIAVVIFNEQLANLVNLNQTYFNLLIGVLVLDALVVAPFAYLRATGRPIKFTAIKLSNVIIFVILNYFFLWAIPEFGINFPGYNPNDLVQYIFIANLCASITTLLLLSPYFFKTKLQFSKTIFKQLLNYGWPIMVAGLAYVINENFDKWLLPEMLGKSINGAYSGCYKIAVFMTIFIQAFRLGAEPFFFNHAKELNAKETYARIMKYFVICGSLMFVFTVAFLDQFKMLLVQDESYWIAIDIVPIVLLANLCLGIYFNLAIWYKLTDKTRFGMYISIFGAIITITFNYIMIPKIGFMASAWATLAAYGSMMLVSYQLGKKHYPVPYDIKRIGSYLVLATLISAVSYYGFNANYYVSTILVLVFLGIVYISERKDIKQLLKS